MSTIAVKRLWMPIVFAALASACGSSPPPDPDADDPSDEGPEVLQAPADDGVDEAPTEEAAPDAAPSEAGKPKLSTE